MGRLFGTDGIRGLTGLELTPEMALRVGRAVGAYFGMGSRVLVGRDARAGGDMISMALSSGLMAEGVKVYDAGLIPTPALQHGVKEGPYDGGIMVTASHNPPEYNGIKVIGGDGVEIPREDEEVVEEYYFRGHASRLEWRSYISLRGAAGNIIDDYIEAIVSHVDVDDISRLKASAVVDCANSVGSLVTPRLLARLGVRPITVNCVLDPTFPGREPEPTPETLRHTSRVVVDYGASVGFAHDGDADRCIVIDDSGQVWWGDRDGALLTWHVAETNKGLPRVTYTGVSSSYLVEEYLAPRGIRVEWTPVGAVVISRLIQSRGGAISGFEENGGYIHVPHQLVRDGAMKVALILEMMAREGGKLSEMYARLPRYYPIKKKYKASRDQSERCVEAVREAYSSYRLIQIDGVKVVGEDFWVLVRPSGTEPVLRVMLEARTRERAERVLSEVESLLYSSCLGRV